MAIDAFASEFVRAYWQTFKDGVFPMPPNEPVEETLDEILADVSTKLATNRTDTIIMTSKSSHHWWEFSFSFSAGAWIITSARAKSLSPSPPHDLLCPPYEQYFRPFLEHVTHIANKNLNKCSVSGGHPVPDQRPAPPSDSKQGKSSSQ